MENSYRFFENKQCEYYPCHKGVENMNCLFCYCPLYLKEDCPGKHTYIKSNGREIKDCTGCTFPHREENYETICKLLGDSMSINKG